MSTEVPQEYELLQRNIWPSIVLAALLATAASCSQDLDGAPPPGRHHSRAGVERTSVGGSATSTDLHLPDRQKPVDPAYRLSRHDGERFLATVDNPAHDFRIHFHRNLPTLHPTDDGEESVGDGRWSVAFKLQRIGRGSRLRPVPRVQDHVFQGGRVVYRRPRGPGIREWYRNGPHGLEQGFEIARRPAGPRGRPLVLEIGVRHDLHPVRQNADAVALKDRHDRTRLVYSGIVVRDSHGDEFDARMAAIEDRIRLVIEEANAAYPLVIDPFFGKPRIISSNVEGPRSVRAADVDGDGDPDVLTSSGGRNDLSWYENTASGFGPQKGISTPALGYSFSVDVADLDGDGDLDVLSTRPRQNALDWFENTSAGFSTRKVISDKVLSASAVDTGDIDGDGDMDVLSAGDLRIAWHENTPSGFGARQIITTDAKIPLDIHAADLDGDDDVDVLSTSSIDNKVAWYENQSSGFGRQRVISTDLDDPISADVGDFDGDGDLDIVVASLGDDKVVWYENDSGFGSPHVVSRKADDVRYVRAVDLGRDGDIDILCTLKHEDKIVWFENTASGFSSREIVADNVNGPLSIDMADIAGDGYLDVVSAAFEGNTIAWHRFCLDTDADGSCKKDDSDDDGDGTVDTRDNCPMVANDSQMDTDSDGVGDACDNCPKVQNSSQKDADGNGTGDACDSLDSGLECEADGDCDADQRCRAGACPSGSDPNDNVVGAGCGCRAGGPKHGPGGSPLLWLGLLVLLVRRHPLRVPT